VRALLSGLAWGTVGLVLGWLTRPIIDGHGRSLWFSEVVHHVQVSEDVLLHAAAHNTIAHVGMFGLACAMLGFVVACLIREM
jgi:hypothetical protein